MIATHLILFLFVGANAKGQLMDAVPGKLRSWTSEADGLLPSQIFVPLVRSADDAQGRSPVILFLHGGGDGPFHIMNKQSLPSLLLSNHSFASVFPFVVLCPCSTCTNSGSRGWTSSTFGKVVSLLELAMKHAHGDPKRVTLTGQSMGGGGLWHYAARQGVWAALVPVVSTEDPNPRPLLQPADKCEFESQFSQCAAIRPSQELADAACCNDAFAYASRADCCPPVWAFHGANDAVVPASFTDRWVDLLRAQPHRGQEVRYTRYPDAPPPPMKEFSSLVGHGSYEFAYRDPALYSWLLTQRCERCHPRGSDVKP